MGKNKALLLPKIERKLQVAGGQIKLARLRRGWTAQEIAEKAAVGRSTVTQIEKGSPSVSMGMYLAVLNALGLSDDILLLAKDDVMGRTYQDLNLKTPRRSKRNGSK